MTQKTIKQALSAVMMLTLLLSPLQLQAVGNCRIDVTDTVAGLGSDIKVSDCGSGGTLSVDILPPFGSNYTHLITLDASGNGTSLVPSNETRTAGQYAAKSTDARTSFTVVADSADSQHSKITASKDRIAADGRETTTVTATVLDRYDNPVGNRPLVLLSSRSGDSIDPQSRQTDGSGRFSWTVSSRDAGSMTLSVYDLITSKKLTDTTVMVGNAAAVITSNPLTAGLTGAGGDFGTIDHFDVKLSKDAPVKKNELFSLTVTALDTANRIVQNYTNTVLITSSDSDSDFPKKGADPKNPDTGSMDFRPSDLGVRSAPLAFRAQTPGEQTFTFVDKNNPAIRGSISITVNGDAQAAGAIQILDPKNNAEVNTTEVLVQGKAPSLINVIAKGGLEDASGETDGEGIFRVKVQLNPAQRDHTIFIRSENKQYESAPLHIVLDTAAPTVESIAFTPESPKEAEKATVTVKAEAGMPLVTMELGKDLVTLQEQSAGSYTATFAAPAMKAYDVKIQARDTAGNNATVLTKLTVQAKGTPFVEGVTAESQPQVVFVRWKQITEEKIGKYNIYIGDSPDNYFYKLETAANATSATIKGLEPGKQYVLAMTAVSLGGEESVQKSDPVTATPLGQKIEATGEDGRIRLHITAPAGIPLSRQKIEFGTEPGRYISSLTFDVAPMLFVPDLINGVRYDIKVTPIDLTGKLLSDLATVVTATPTGDSGFHPAAGDPVPGDIGIQNPPNITPDDTAPPDIYTNPPSIPHSGLPLAAMMTILILAVGIGSAGLLHLQRRKQAHSFMQMMHRRYRQ